MYFFLRRHLSYFVLIVSFMQLVACSSSSSNAPSGGGNSITCASSATGYIQITGIITFDRVNHLSGGGLDYTNISADPSRGIIVEAIQGSVIASTTTESDGSYCLAVPEDTQNIFIRAKAQMNASGSPSWNFRVVDHSNGRALYAMDGSTFSVGTANIVRNLHADSGWTGSSYGSTRVAAPFAILDTIYDAVQTILAESSSLNFPALNINWHSENTQGSYYDGSEIYILGKANNDTDEYDEHVIAHEWGHYFQDNFSRDDSIGGAHAGGDLLDIRLAFSEGFGNAFSAIVTGDPIYKDAQGTNQNGLNSFSFSLENNNCVNAGWFSECSIQALLYDLYDPANDDAISLGFTPIYDVLTASMPTQDAFTSVFSFIKPLKDHASTNAAAIDALVATQSIDDITDIFGDSETTHNPGTTDVLPIYESGSTNVCSSGENGGYNKLGVYRFFKFTSTGGIATFTATRTSGRNPADPDLELFDQGSRIAVAWSDDNDSETMQISLTAGKTYILQLNEYLYFDDSYLPNASTDITCFDVTLTQ